MFGSEKPSRAAALTRWYMYAISRPIYNHTRAPKREEERKKEQHKRDDATIVRVSPIKIWKELVVVLFPAPCLWV